MKKTLTDIAPATSTNFLEVQLRPHISLYLFRVAAESEIALQ